LNHIEAIKEIADLLNRAERVGAERDEPEGMRYIMISDTCARMLAYTLDGIAVGIEANNNG
jgi:hypothetical protein